MEPRGAYMKTYTEAEVSDIVRESYDSGRSRGYSVGHTEGYRKGCAEGYSDGYDDGYNDTHFFNGGEDSI